MFDQPYKREDLGFSYVVSPLGEIVTDPGFKPGEWFVKHTDEQGIFIMSLDEELTYFSGNDPLWEQQTKAVFNGEETVIMLFKVGEVEKEWNITTLLHQSAVQAYITIDCL